MFCGCWENVIYTLCQHCISSRPQYCHNVGQHPPALGQWIGNVVWTLWQCHSPALGTDIYTTFRQHCVNIVAMSLWILWTDIETKFRQCCVNVVAILWTKFDTTFSQHCVHFVSTLVTNNVLGRFRPRMAVIFKFDIFQLQHQHTSLYGNNHINIKLSIAYL